MRAADAAELLMLAALWGASFLCMRLGAGEFGPVALAGLRVLGAALFLLPWLLLRGQLAALRARWRPIAVVGLTNSALPFLAYSYAALSLSAGLASIFNATAPLWAALIAWLWLKDRLTAARTLGLAIGFGGVLWLVWRNVAVSIGPQAAADAWAMRAAIAACVGATLCYGWSACFTKKHLAGVAPLAVATGSQLAAALLLAPAMLWWWPAQSPSPRAWLAAALLAFACTGVAYVMYFRLIARIGPANAIAVTFLIPLFAVGWGWLVLGEALTATMAIGGAIIVLGTALATGVLKPRGTG